MPLIEIRCLWLFAHIFIVLYAIWHREHKRYPANWTVTNCLALNLSSLCNRLPLQFIISTGVLEFFISVSNRCAVVFIADGMQWGLISNYYCGRLRHEVAVGNNGLPLKLTIKVWVAAVTATRILCRVTWNRESLTQSESEGKFLNRY